MDPLVAVYDQQQQNVNSLKHRIRFPVGHGINLPPSVDLRPWMTEIKNQGDMDSCAANAVAASIEYLYKRYTGCYTRISRLFIDYNSRCVNNNVNPYQRYQPNENDDPDNPFGTNREASLRAVQMYGYCAESLWSNNLDNYMKPPPQYVYDEAASRSIVPLRIPVDVVSLKTCLAHEIPVLIGIQLSESDDAHYRGWVHLPTNKLPPKGNVFHACLIVGYDDQTQHFIIRNSWGSDWGDQGYGYVPYQYFIHRQLVVTDSACWAIVQLVPRGMIRRGYFSYPNYTQYHLQYILPKTITNYKQQQQQPQQKYQYRRRKQ